MRILGVLKQKNGFSLIELLISMAIFGVLMVAFLSLFSSALYITLRAGDRDKTVANISGKVEKSMASETYTDAEVTHSATTVMITFGDGTSEIINVEKTTGTSQMKDGTNVKIDSYTTAG